ncbi:NDP-sugar synthase [Candidatus Parcubacteria bacterium]|nr:NDP-sugar synthase [Patescibacteria group bacterium]MBU4466711.1 NDP-sugar synthase [Patescibacteria group bacterium]MCG2688020.1 NDP-sugar synthase [Candidatus Parcubacteria bacterium]
MQAVIIAAGESSRFWPLNQKHKGLTKIMGKSLIACLVEDLKKSGIKNIIIVQSSKKDIENDLKDDFIQYVIQKKPTGTGDALLCAAKLIKDSHFFLINADEIDAKEAISLMLAKVKKNKKGLLMLASETETPWFFGVIKVKGNKVLEIVEKPKQGKELSNLKNDNLFLMPKDFLDYLKKIPSHPFSLIYALNIYAQKQKAEIVVFPNQTLSLKYPWNILPILWKKLAELKSFKHKTAIIGKNVVIHGKVFIGSGTKIGDNTVIHGPCYIGKNCEIGASNVFRGPVNLEDNVKTGSFFEIKSSLVQTGTHFHSGYLGDSSVGSDCRFGGGFMSANRRIDRNHIFSSVKGDKINSGLTYLGVCIGDRTMISVGVKIMPGVFIGSNCVVGPATVVFQNINDDTIFYQEFKNIVSKKK